MAVKATAVAYEIVRQGTAATLSRKQTVKAG